MIFESYPWKEELYNFYKVLVKFIHSKPRYNNSFEKPEKAIMFSAYIIRKLYDAEKFPLEFFKENINVHYYEKKKGIIDHLNRHKIEDNYDLEKPKKKSVSIEYILNQIIHSFTFTFIYDQDYKRFHTIFINSDKSKKETVFEVKLEFLIKIILKISEGDINVLSCKRKENGEMKQEYANYMYDDGFDLDKIVEDSINNRIIYQRNKIYEKPMTKKQYKEYLQNFIQI